MDDDMKHGPRALSMVLALLVALLTASLAAQDTSDPYTGLVRLVVGVRDSLRADYLAAADMDRALIAYKLGVWTRDPQSAAVRPWNDRVAALYDLAMMKRGQYSLSAKDYPRRPRGDRWTTPPHWTKALRDLNFLLVAERFDELDGSYWQHWPGLLDEVKHLGEARLANRRHDLDTALEEYALVDQLAEDDVVRGIAIVGAAEVFNRQQNYQLALDTLLYTLQNGGFSDDALFATGRTLIYLGRIREAISMMQITLEVNPLHEQAHYYLGNGYAPLNYTQIEQRYPQAFPTTPEERDALRGIRSLMQTGFYPQAADTLLSLRRLNPSWIDPVVMLAEISWLKGDMDLSEQFCLEALKLIPDYGRAHAILAKVQETRRLTLSSRRTVFRDSTLKTPIPEVPAIEDYVLNWDELSPRHQLIVALSVYPWRNFIPVLQETGSTLYIKPLHERLSEAPYMTPLCDQRINLDSRLWDDVRGAGGFHTVTGIEDVERELYGGYNTVVHEVTHQVHGLLTTPEKHRLQAAYENAKSKTEAGKQIFLSRYQASTVWEYFAEGVNAYVSPQVDEWDEREVVRERLGRDTTLLAIVRDYLAINEMGQYLTEGHVNATYQDLEEGQAQHAWERLGKIDATYDDSRPVLAATSTVASLLEMDSLAIAKAQRYIQLYPDEPDGYSLLATAVKHAPNGQPPVLTILSGALERNRLNPRAPVHQRYARELHLAGAFSDAVAHFDSALAVQADNPDALWGKAEALADSAMLSGDTSAARLADEEYRKVVRIRNGVAELRLDYARLLILRDQLELAQEQISEAESLIPGDPLALSYRAWLSAIRGDSTTAWQLLAKARDSDAMPDEATIVASYLHLPGVEELSLVLGEMAGKKPTYVYNPRRYRYETRGEIVPWYMVLLRSEMRDDGEAQVGMAE